ncbi:hypothetical protein BJ138DRAFT_1113622 [Hygrophoropsis aurantiaca]|uniref:Uncharacterized protein n=1 Tax=Hygrophoropsis aurantiaca TaxID=72124 RepID=A0ACB8ACC9_9AGAM|nr:hypothetical protein BJ138DRAFT_1113622 [Hygrophoropsis aurantiaca]
MSDPRFLRLKTDPRFRRPKKQNSKVVVDDRFKSVFDTDSKKEKGKTRGRVDKYGRKVSSTQEGDNLRRFYRLENEEAEEYKEQEVVDYARGGIILESSDEEEDERASEGDDSDTGGFITLGGDPNKLSHQESGDEDEVDLDEDNFADLDAQAAAFAKNEAGNTDNAEETPRTRRLAVVNLDWDHVRAIHLYKIFSSLLSPSASAAGSVSSAPIHPDRQRTIKTSPTVIGRGKVVSVRVYPSEFGKERMTREEKEGPPAEVFKKKKVPENEEDINEKTIFETGDSQDYNEEALRTYQLERLRYYYAIVECDTIEAASHIYSELDGTELERSANVFDLSFVPDDMTFEDEYRDEATDEISAPYRAIEFVTDALRHSKVKLTWDEDDPERNNFTRRPLTRKEIEEADFKAYIASSSSGSESEGEPNVQKKSKGKSGKKAASRDKLRALLLGGNEDELPEGWGQDEDTKDNDDIDMEITFTPGLSEVRNDGEDETTLEKYQRKMKEKRKKRKEETKVKSTEIQPERQKPAIDDDFFDAGSDDGSESDIETKPRVKGDKKRGESMPAAPESARRETTTEELALLVASDNPNGEPAHFNMKSVLKAEKKHRGKKKKGKKDVEEDNEIQEDFTIDVTDSRFKAVHEDHQFAIDPSNPRFKKTKSMAALLGERTKRQKGKYMESNEDPAAAKASLKESYRNLQNLVESVKRKSKAADQRGVGKRRKL